jgi:predicted MFS family arabinose efflux permease
MLGFAFSLQSVPPVLRLIIEDLKLSHAEAGSLTSLFALPAIFLAILAGLLSDRWGTFKTGLISLTFLIAGTLIFATSGSFSCACLGRVVAGIGATTISIVAAQTLSRWFRGREIGTAMGIYNTAMPVSTIICFTTFGGLGESLGWRMPILLTMMIGVSVLTAFVILYKRPPGQPHKIAPQKEEKVTCPFSSSLKLGGLVWLVGVCWMWFNAATISFLTFAPDFFISKGHSIGSAGFLTSLLMWGSLGLSPIIGRLVDKVGNEAVFIGVGGIMMATAIYLFTCSTNFLFPMVAMAVAVALIPAPVFSFPSRILQPENLGLGFGILSTLSSTGMVFGPYLAGLVRDKTDSYETSFLFLSMLAVLVTITAFILKARVRRGYTDGRNRGRPFF